jgi:hypothetical protein
MNEGEKRSRRRVRFDSKVPARMMGIDGTWQRECVVDDISDGGAKLTVSGSIGNLPLQEFFLVLSSTGLAYRHCKLSPGQWRTDRRVVPGTDDGEALFVTCAAHGDATQPIATDFSRSTQGEIKHAPMRERTAVQHRALDPLAVVEIGHHKDRAERLGPMCAGNLIGLETLAARVPLVFPVDRGFFVVRWRPRDTAHPHLLKSFRRDRLSAQDEHQRGKPSFLDPTAVLSHHSTAHLHTTHYPTRPIMVNAEVTNWARACLNGAHGWRPWGGGERPVRSECNRLKPKPGSIGPAW